MVIKEEQRLNHLNKEDIKKAKKFIMEDLLKDCNADAFIVATQNGSSLKGDDNSLMSILTSLVIALTDKNRMNPLEIKFAVLLGLKDEKGIRELLKEEKIGKFETKLMMDMINKFVKEANKNE